MPRSKFRIFKLIIITIVLLIVVFIGYYLINSYIKDQLTLKQTNKVLNWIEYFYTDNGRYPSQVEFKNNFSNFKSKEINYSDSEQSFLLIYPLIKRRSNAPGHPGMELFGYTGKYYVEPCPRWDELELGQPKVLIDISPVIIIYSDFNAGEIYFAHREQLNEKILLLSGLDKPRLFKKTDNKNNNIFVTANVSKTNIVITDKNNVIYYEWDDLGLKLKNPQKIGVVPIGCPISSSS